MRRRRTFVGGAALLLVIVLFVVLGRHPAAPSTYVAGSSTPSTPVGSTSPSVTTPPPSAAMPPAYLAWMSGGFPESFRTGVRSIQQFQRSVVVAGDTLWLTRTHAADGVVVDDPTPPFGFPIDAFAVDPVAYAPFVAESVRPQVTSALTQGKAVLGQASADLRGIKVGGSMTFGHRTLTVGAVVPNDAVGWSEMMVSRSVGVKLGISDDRYLLAQIGTDPPLLGFQRWVARLLPADTPLRVVQPDGSRYMRVASGVNPPIVLKQTFGEFSAHPNADPAYLTEDPAWVHSHIQTRTVPLLGRVTCNRVLFPPLIAALKDVQQAGLRGLIHTNSGCWNARTVARSPTAPPSNHAYGAAVDINAPENPYGGTPTMDPRIVQIFVSHGFNWGGDFLIPDGMHFEYLHPDASG